MVYHHYMLEQSLDKIKASMGPLHEKMAVLNRATLPARFKNKEVLFVAARKDLDKAVAELVHSGFLHYLGKIKSAIESMHDRYVTLAAVFE